MGNSSEVIKAPAPVRYKHDEAEIKRFVREAIAMDCAREALSRIYLNLEVEPPSEIPEYTTYSSLGFGISARHVRIVGPVEAYSAAHEIDHSAWADDNTCAGVIGKIS